MRQRRLYIHIGAPKTGSTYLQRAACRMRDRLRDNGLLYPEATARGHGHHDIAFLVSGGYPDWAVPQDRPLDALGGEIAAETAGYDGDVLISSEDFYLFPAPEALKSFLESYPGLSKGREVRIIVYVRRQDDLFLSWYNQQVKALGYSGSFDDALPAMEWMGDYAVQLDRWAAVFGEDALDVADYRTSATKPGGLWADFAARLGVPNDIGFYGDGENVNTRLSRDALEVQRVINRLPISILEKRSFHKLLMQLSVEATELFSDAPIISNAERRELLQRFDDSNRALFSRFITDSTAFDASDLTDQRDAAYPGLSQEAVLAIISWLIMRYRAEPEPRS